MRKKFLQFFTRLFMISVLLGALFFILQAYLPENILSPAIPYLLSMFLVVTAIVHFILLRITAMNPRKFVGYFMLATFIKLLNYLIVIFVYVFYVKEGILPFILSFFFLYIIYTVFEVITILAQTRT